MRFAGSEIAVHSAPDKSLYHAMNKGISLSRGDTIGFPNADDCFAERDSLVLLAMGLSIARWFRVISISFVITKGAASKIVFLVPCRG